MKGKVTDKFLNKIDDIQAQTEGFPKIPINKVGVRNIKIPFSLQKRNSSEFFHTVATVSSYCELDGEKKGINMSRISRSIGEFVPKFGKYDEVEQAVKLLKKNHKSKTAWIKIKFDYIIDSKSPLTDENSYEPIECEMECFIDENNKVHNYITVQSTEMSLCPCSKNMSLLMNNLTDEESKWIKDNNDSIPDSLKVKLDNVGFGAHNQKSKIKVSVQANNGKVVWLEDLFDIIQESASSPTYTTLKRADEKYVTEVSYGGGYVDEDGKWNVVEGAGPKFVEDIGRIVASKLDKFIKSKQILDWTVVVDNQESIHSDDISACAILYYNKDLKNNY